MHKCICLDTVQPRQKTTSIRRTTLHVLRRPPLYSPMPSYFNAIQPHLADHLIFTKFSESAKDACFYYEILLYLIFFASDGLLRLSSDCVFPQHCVFVPHQCRVSSKFKQNQMKNSNLDHFYWKTKLFSRVKIH